MSKIIEVKNLSYVYGEDTPFVKTAVNDVSFDIEQGDFVGVIGHTGSGKSTLIQHFNGLVKPSKGTVLIDGVDIWGEKTDKKAVRFNVGLVFQYPEYQLFEETVFKDIAYGPTNMGLTKEEINKRVLDASESVGISFETLEKSPFELSGGQKRRVAIAGVLAMKPKVLVLDEPTAGLDPKGRDKILKLVKQYHEKTNSTIILVSHSMEDIAKYCNNVLVMNKSKLFCFDSVDNVFKRGVELEKLGLSIPQVSKMFNKLGEKFAFEQKNIYTVKDAKEEILKYIKNRNA